MLAKAKYSHFSAEQAAESADGSWFGFEAPTVGTETVIGGLVEKSTYRPENDVWLISSYNQTLKFLCP